MKYALTLIFGICLMACTHGPLDINYNKDACDFCKMTITDKRFSAQCLSSKGKSFKFDDIHCMVSFLKNGGVWSNEIEGVYFSNYNGKPGWITSDMALLLRSDELRSPMGGNIAAFENKEDRENVSKKINGEDLVWEDIDPKKL